MDKSPYQEELQIPKQLMEKGLTYKKDFVHEKKPDGKTSCYVYSSSIDDEITLDAVESFKNASYLTWSQFEKNAFNIHTITFPSQAANWKQATCTCPAYNVHFICKHIIGIGIQVGLLSNEEQQLNYDDDPLYESKRGRPKKPSSALVYE